MIKTVQETTIELIEKIGIELEKYVDPVAKKSMTMKESIDKAKTKCSEKKTQENEIKNYKLSNKKIKRENELRSNIHAKILQKLNFIEVKIYKPFKLTINFQLQKKELLDS